MTDPVRYTLRISHWQDGSVDLEVEDIEYSEHNVKSIIYALETIIADFQKPHYAQDKAKPQ
ncbi:MAG: hypothetical protein KGL39_59310 [Patescibacteria group bacterium]|nr:hypothetical protein [Patescibacteria group bacterium]